jgi:hypothetical protein
MIAEFGARIAEINEAKADRRAVDLALNYKADKVVYFFLFFVLCGHVLLFFCA